jgi:hypothetical protein
VKRAWSPAAEAKLARLYREGTPLSTLAFLLKRTRSAVKSRAGVLGLTRGDRHPWTKADDQRMRREYPDAVTADLAKAMGRTTTSVHNRAHTLGLSKSEAFLASDRSGRALRGKQSPGMRRSQFKQGHVPANKGLRRPGWSRGRMHETQFKKGEMAGAAQHNYVPVGTEKVRDGLLCRKVTDDPNLYPAARWQPVSRIVWEAANGPIPPGHAVVFRAGRFTTEREAITVDALELVTRAELMRRNSYLTRYPKEVADVIRLRGALNRKIRNRSKQA